MNMNETNKLIYRMVDAQDIVVGMILLFGKCNFIKRGDAIGMAYKANEKIILFYKQKIVKGETDA